MRTGTKPVMVFRWLLLLLMLGEWGCATASKEEVVTLLAPNGSVHKAVQAMEDGNRLFKASEWAAAKAQYEAAIAAQPTMAEAHYNLALALERLGNKKAAYDHYIKAATLAPGHRIIWDSPPLRKHGDVEAHTGSASDMKMMPGMGGLGGTGGTGY